MGKGGGLRDGAETETKGGVGVEGIVELEDGASAGIFFGKFVRRPGLVADGGEGGAELVKAEPHGFFGGCGDEGENLGMNDAKDREGVGHYRIGDHGYQPIKRIECAVLRSGDGGFAGEEEE